MSKEKKKTNEYPPAKERWKSRKLWFHIAGFVAGLVFAYFELLTMPVAAFIVTMSVGYSSANVIQKYLA